MRTVAILANKGGTGKTSLTIGLASAAAHRGLSVLVIDLDPQGNATSILRSQVGDTSVADVLAHPTKAMIESTIAPCDWDAYIGELEFRGEWYPGKHEPLIDRPTWERVQVLLGGQNYHCHALTYGGELMTCAHCGHPITGECKTKMTKGGPRSYVYYRCAKYTKAGHPRIRVPEADLEKQVLALFDRMRVEDESVRDWFRMVLASQTRDAQAESLAQRAELQRQETLLVQQQDRLLNMRLADDIDQETFGRKGTEIRDRLASIKLQLDALDRSHDENAELASKVFELSQTLRQQWLTADYDAKRRILEIVCLNWKLDGVSLVPTMRKPFDVLAEGLISQNSRADRIRTCDLLTPRRIRQIVHSVRNY